MLTWSPNSGPSLKLVINLSWTDRFGQRLCKNAEFDIEVVKRVKINAFIGRDVGLINTHSGICLRKVYPCPI